MAEGNNNEVMIQLPWTVPQQPLYTTHVNVDPESKKIPIDLNVSSTDWVVAGSVLLSFLAFAVTIYVVKQSTKSQIKSNKLFIASQKKLKNLELENLHNQEILRELNIFEMAFKNIGVYLKLKSDRKIEITPERTESTIENLEILNRQMIVLGNLILAYKGIDIREDFQQLDIKIWELIDELKVSGWLDTKISSIIKNCEEITESIHSKIKAA
ncbi:hypothetical protein [Acinetobacter sp.]|uniref:hypothetical protein n=1 Tax=Acinetobacter sp. TaxID=472 RepID=UPI00388DB53C